MYLLIDSNFNKQDCVVSLVVVTNSTSNTIMVALTDISTGNPAASELATFKTVSNYPPIGATQTGITAACTVYMNAATNRYVRVYSYLPPGTQTSSTGLSVLQITKLNWFS